MRAILFLLTFFPAINYAQSTDSSVVKKPLFSKALKGDPFSLQGNISTNFRSYNAWGVESRQTPFSSTISANATLQSYQFTIPFTFLLNNLSDPSVNTPFSGGYFKNFFKNQKDRLARFGASPQRGWFRAHIGDRYMSFSEYTMNNHNFRGAGVEINPGKLRFAAMAGRLAKAEPRNLSILQPNFQAYERTGWGAKIGYGEENNFIDVIMFKASDRVENLDPISEDSTSALTPQQNLVLGLNGRKQLGKQFSFEFEIAQSALTRNITDPEYSESAVLPLHNSFLFKSRGSTEFRSAYKTGVFWNAQKMQTSLRYSRIGPGYKTLGAYFFNDDLENITFNLNTAIFKKCLNISSSAGLQRNNLDGTKASNFKRLIGNLNIYYHKNRWSLGSRFNNFDSRVDYAFNSQTDSLIAILISRDLTFFGGYLFTNQDGTTNQLNLNVGLQGVIDNISDPELSSNSDMLTLNCSYVFRNSSGWQYSVGFDYNNNSFINISSSRIGYNMMIMKSLSRKKINLILGSNFYHTKQTNSENSNRLFSNYLQGDFSLGLRQKINFHLTWLNNNSGGNSLSSSFSELTASLGYSMSFGWKTGTRGF